MPICFVIQPFDGGKFDRRYDDTFRPAIEETGLESYRVDQDPSVEVPIDEIERKIRDAAICLADISTDNPNVWYELGYAFASKKKVLMICSDERKDAFPFDIRHKRVVKYRTDSRGGYEKLQREIEEGLKSLLGNKEREEGAQVGQGEREDGLSEIELKLLGVITDERPLPNGPGLAVSDLVRFAEGTMRGVEIGVGFRGLQDKGFIIVTEDYPYEEVDVTVNVVTLTRKYWDWISDNWHLFSSGEGGDRVG